MEEKRRKMVSRPARRLDWQSGLDSLGWLGDWLDRFDEEGEHQCHLQ